MERGDRGITDHVQRIERHCCAQHAALHDPERDERVPLLCHELVERSARNGGRMTSPMHTPREQSDARTVEELLTDEFRDACKPLKLADVDVLALFRVAITSSC